jgi:hypothetical protein
MCEEKPQDMAPTGIRACAPLHMITRKGVHLRKKNTSLMVCCHCRAYRMANSMFNSKIVSARMSLQVSQPFHPLSLPAAPLATGVTSLHDLVLLQHRWTAATKIVQVQRTKERKSGLQHGLLTNQKPMPCMSLSKVYLCKAGVRHKMSRRAFSPRYVHRCS